MSLRYKIRQLFTYSICYWSIKYADIFRKEDVLGADFYREGNFRGWAFQGQFYTGEIWRNFHRIFFSFVSLLFTNSILHIEMFRGNCLKEIFRLFYFQEKKFLRSDWKSKLSIKSFSNESIRDFNFFNTLLYQDV